MAHFRALRDRPNYQDEISMTQATARRFLVGMVAFWLPFGLITVFAPAIMDLFQTQEGVAAKTAFSNHVWMHGGFDILSICALVFALTRLPLSAAALRAVGVAALMPAIAIGWSLLGTSYWSPLFVVPGVACLAFAVGAFVIAGRLADDERSATRPVAREHATR